MAPAVIKKSAPAMLKAPSFVDILLIASRPTKASDRGDSVKRERAFVTEEAGSLALSRLAW